MWEYSAKHYLQKEGIGQPCEARERHGCEAAKRRTSEDAERELQACEQMYGEHQHDSTEASLERWCRRKINTQQNGPNRCRPERKDMERGAESR